MDRALSHLKKLTKTDISAVILMAAAFIFLFVMAYFDGTISDEAFYISIPLRLINGDGLFTDEWHLSQLSSVLLYLPVKLFVAVTGGTQGIILFMRRLFCIMQLTAGAYTYKTFRKEGFPAVLISVSFMLYSVIGLNTLSYNTMGIALLILIICSAFSLSEKPSLTKMFFMGFFMASFILCQPVGVVFFLIYFIAAVAFNITFSRKKKPVPFPFGIKSFFAATAGILPVLAFFLYLLLKSSDIETIIKCIPGILSDVEHMEITENLGIATFSGVQFFTDMTMAAGAVPLIITAVLIAASLIVKKKNKPLAVIITSFAVIAFSLILYYRLLFMSGTTETDDVNFCFFPIAFSGIAFYLLSDKKNHKVFLLLWCTGIMYALFMTVSSNLRLHASVNGYIIAAAGSLLLAKDLFGEMKTVSGESKLKNFSAIILALAVFGSAVFNTGALFFSPVIMRSEYPGAKMTKGIYEGITLPSDQALSYTNIYSDTKRIGEIITPEDKVFVLENIPAAYIDGSFGMGAHSGWFIAEQLAFREIRDRFRNYYEINPENIPDYIYVPAYTYTESGLAPIAPKMQAEFAYALFAGETEDIGSGLLIKVTEIKDE